MKRHFWKTVNLLILIDNSIVQKFRNKAKKTEIPSRPVIPHPARV